MQKINTSSNRLYKRYVGVITFIDREGSVRPLYIIWENNIRYAIDKVCKVSQRASIVGGCGLCFECMISGQRRNLFYERNRWFIESTKP